MINTAMILCGGKGTRLLPYTKKIPKPMIKIKNKPFLLILCEQLKNAGIKRIILLTGYKSNVIKNYFDKVKIKDCEIIIFKTPTYYLTGKRIEAAKYLVKGRFLLLYGDNLVFLKINNYLNEFAKNNYRFGMIVKKAKDAGEIGNCELKNSNYFYKKIRSRKFKYLDLGYFIFDKKIFNYLDNLKNIDLSDIIYKLSSQKMFYYYLVKGRYLSITDKNRLAKTRLFFK